MSPAPRHDAAVLVFARSPQRDALRWGWTRPAALDARRSLLTSLLARIAPVTGADVLVFHDGDPADLLTAPGVRGFVPQSGTTFARRLQNALAHAFARGYRRVVLIGTDIPGLSHLHLQHALDRLDHAPLVIGPDTTGGAYLLALRPEALPCLADIPWGTGRDVAALQAAHPAARLVPHALADLDTLLAATPRRDPLPKPVRRLVTLLRHLLAPRLRSCEITDRSPAPQPASDLPQALRPTGPPMPLRLSPA